MSYGDADVTEIRQQFADDTAEWDAIRDEAKIDMRFISGDPWEPDERNAREKVNRLVLSFDELNQYTNQVINDLRANKRAVQFTPNGNGASEKTAEFYADKMREIEYRSKAQIAYTTAAENAIQRSYGFCRVTTRYESPRSVNQDIWIDPVHNPDLVTPDPYALMPDLSDQNHCWVREPWARDDFNRQYPEAKLEGRAHSELMRDATQWVTDRLVWVSEQWKVKTKSRILLVVQMPSTPPPGGPLGLRGPATMPPVGIFKDELNGRPLPHGATVLTQREVEDQTVCQYLTNGVEILDEKDWPGRYIPIVSCLGKVIYVDEGGGAKRKILSMVRLVRDPVMSLSYIRTCEMELIGQVPKFPYFVPEGSLAPDQLENLARSVSEPVAVVQYKVTVPSLPPGTVLPPPQRNNFEPAIQALELSAEAMRRAIQSSIALSFLPTTAQRRNEKSGVALKHIEEMGQRGSYHFTDNYINMIARVGVLVEDLMSHIYDTARDVGIRKANEDAEIVRINDPAKDSYSTQGDHLVTVSTGPSFDSEREAASDFADTLAQSNPAIFAALGPLIVKLKNLGPIGDEMIEILEALQPPPVQALRASKTQQGGQLDPQQAAKALAGAQAHIQQLTQMAEQMKQALDTKQAEQQGKIQQAGIDARTQITLQKMKDATSIAVAKIAALTKGVVSDNEAQVESIALAHEAEQNALDRGHEAALTEAESAHEAGMASLEHVHTLAQGQQAAALAPPPSDNGAGA